MAYGWWNDYDWSNPQTYFNKFYREVFYPDRKDMDWNDYQSVDFYSTDPVFGRVFATRKKELENEENTRYWNDKARNMGFDLDDVSYPIRTGIYGSAVGPGSYFEASESVIGLFDSALLKWK